MDSWYPSFWGVFGARLVNFAVVVGLCVLVSAADLDASPVQQGPVLSASHHKVQVDGAAAAAQLTAAGGRLVADYGICEVPEITATLLRRPEIVSRDQYNLIMLNAARLDTSTPELQAARNSVGSFTGKRLHLMQFAGPVQPQWREALLATGAKIVTYVPENAYPVYGDAEVLGQVQAFAAQAPKVQLEGTYLDDYKIHPAARTVDAAGQPREIGTDEFAVQLVADPEANPRTLALLEALKLRPIRRPGPHSRQFTAMVPSNCWWIPLPPVHNGSIACANGSAAR